MVALRGQMVGAAIRLLAEIPRGAREGIVRDMRLEPVNEAPLLQAASELPDPVPIPPETAFRTALEDFIANVKQAAPPSGQKR